MVHARGYQIRRVGVKLHPTHARRPPPEDNLNRPVHHEPGRYFAPTQFLNPTRSVRRRPEAQLALRLRQKRRPPATPPTPAIIAETRFAHPWRSLGARLRRLIIVPSDRNETDNDLRRDPTPTSVQAGDSVFPSEETQPARPASPNGLSSLAASPAALTSARAPR
jgi:hypothetical protein